MSDKDIVQEAREAFQAAQDAEMDNLAQMRLDLRFLAGDQWDPDVVALRKSEKKPVFTINRLPQYVRQVTGDIRLNPPGIKVRAVDSGADPKTAEIYTGLIRNIEARCNAKQAYVTAGDNAAGGGVGYFRITYDYRDEDGFDMDLGIERIPSPFAVAFDPGAIDPTGKDGKYCFVSDMVPLAEFKRRYPDASLDGWEDPAYGGWRDGDFVRVAEWFRKVPVKKTLFRLKSGAVIDGTDLEDDELRDAINAGGGVDRERVVNTHKVVVHLLNGSAELAPARDWPGIWLPVVRVVGSEINVGDRVVRHGVVRYARDPQAIYNIQRTAAAESASMAVKPKWLATWKQVSAHLKFWQNANTSNTPILPYDPDPAAQGPPQRIQPDMPAASALGDAQLAATEIEATIGMYRENLGRESNAQSGRAILSRQREGDVGTFVYSDNLADAVAHGGTILVDLLPKTYDTARQVRIIGPDGREDFVPINTPLPALPGEKPKLINDLNAGRYDVIPSVGPSYSTQREEARESMMAFFQAAPQAAAAAGDIFAETMDWPNADALKGRLRRMAIMQGLADPDPNDEDDAKIIQALQAQGQKPDPNMVLAQAEMVKAQAAMASAQAKQMEAQAEAMKAEVEAQQNGFKLSIQAADVASKVRERDAGVMRDGVRHTVDIVRAVTQPPQQQGMQPR